jgi:hypothetical protein
MLSVTANSCGSDRSLAKDSRLLVVQAQAPEIHAFFSVTMWPMSTSEAAVQVAPSYGLCQVPAVAVQALLTTTLVPSCLRTVSRVSQVPEMMSQVGNRLRW